MSNPYDTPDTTSVLGATLRFKGELTADEDLLILGVVEGSIEHSARLTVGEQGTVKADVRAEHIAVEGCVEGDLYGSKSISIRSTANVKGNIHSETVTLVEGAVFNGTIDMDGAASTASDTAKDQPGVDSRRAGATGGR